PNRVDDEVRVRVELGVAQGRPILVVAGRIQPLKDQELAVRAVARLRAAGGVAPVLVVAGEATPGDEDYVRRIRSLADELGVGEDVRFVGAMSREALARLLSIASLTLLTSHSETFGLVALESAASGTPVVGFRGSGMVESIAEGESGIFVDTRDPDDWAAAISALLEDPRSLARMSGSARDHALGYTWAASATALLSVYGSL
ncbi:MAG: glycosyltransferase, partial [Terrimesophilobacter sp.]